VLHEGMPKQVVVPGTGRPFVDGDSLDFGGPLVFTIDGVLDADACAGLIARIDALGPTAAPISTARGFEMRSDIRNNTRVIFDDPAFAAALFDRIAAELPSLFGMRPVGANERFRCYRYDAGQRFAPHYDGAFVRSDAERSELTFMVYLNEGFGGGETKFFSFDQDISIDPRPGRALLFQHHLLHEGSEVTHGVKYVLRSDVMYRR
jgi:prolyl 4-hydroxylase